MNEIELNQALRQLAAEYLPMPGADAIERRLVAEFANQRTNWWKPAITLAMVASLAAIGFFRDVRRAPEKEVFIAIPYTIPPAAYERTTVVHMDVEIAALRAAGFQVGALGDGSIPADVMFAQDGRAVAIHTFNVPIL